MRAYVRSIEYHLPGNTLDNVRLALDYPEWTADKITEKTGIAERRISGEGECASDLAVEAAKRLFASGVCQPQEVDFLLFCTQSPDYFLPTTACLIQDRLGLPTTCGALDYNLGCSGFVYGLSLAKGLVETGQARNVLLLMAETYSKFMHPQDKGTRTLFGDAASAILVSGVDGDKAQGDLIGPFVYGTDGRGGKNLMVEAGGMRKRHASDSAAAGVDEAGNFKSDSYLYMNGPEIFTFTLKAVPQSVRAVLERAQAAMEDIDLFVFHQANQYMLDHLRKKCKIPEEKFYLCMRHCGNTVSSTIPIALKHAELDGRLQLGMRVMLVGFGVGYSWGACLIRWKASR